MLDPARAGLTVPSIGATIAADFPARPTERFSATGESAPLGDRDEDWDRAVADVLRWGVKRRAGFRVPTHPVVLGEDVEVRFSIGPITIREPVRVVAIVDEPDRRGFAYATRPGHPIRGEEAFLVERDDDGMVWFRVQSISAPGSGVWRGLWPLIRLAQGRFRARYLRVAAGS